MHAARGIGILTLFLLASCAGVKSTAPAEPLQAAAPQIAPEPTVPPDTGTIPVAPAPSPAAASPATRSASQDVAKAAPPSPKAPATAPAPVAQTPQADATKQKAPPLDLDSLKERLKDTRAIGVLTKITLKNQVDDLLDKFREYYQGKLKITLAELRRSYELLVQKVLALLQDSDPSLATAIVASRDAIWGILSDPKKFATI